MRFFYSSKKWLTFAAFRVQQKALDKHFDEAQIILLQVSASFLASEDWPSIEQRAIKRHEHEAHVIPVILRSAMWEITFLKNLQPLPDNRKPIAEWPAQMRDRAYKNVATGIFKVIQELEALNLSNKRRTLKANLDQLIETVTSQIQPLVRAEALKYTLQQSRMIIPEDVTLADLVAGWYTLSRISKQGEDGATSQRRVTCGELAQMASQFVDGEGNLTQAIKTWHIWAEAFKKSGDPRQATMAKTFARELTELQEAKH